MELEDQAWFPAVWRDAGTAYLEFAARFNDPGAGIAKRLAPVLEATGTRRLVDLCSGGTGPLPGVLAELEREGLEATALLTDRFPNLPSFQRLQDEIGKRVEYAAEPVDALAVPAELSGLRTLFNALHHFRPEDARGLLQDAVDAGQPVAAFEVVGRHPLQLLGLLMSPVLSLLLMPFARPFRWSWLFWTYVVPVIPLFILWDGVVSGLRVYSIPELHELVAGLRGREYVWEIGAESMTPVPAPVTFLVGRPKSPTPVARHPEAPAPAES